MPHRGSESDRSVQHRGQELGSLGLHQPFYRLQSGDHETGLSRRDFVVAAGICLSAVVVGVGRAESGDKTKIRVGFIFPEQGPLAQESKSLLTGFELFLKERGLRPFEIIKKDSGPDDEKTLEALTGLLVNQKIEFLVSPPSLAGSEKIIHGMVGSKAILFVTNPSVRLVAGEMCLPGAFRTRPNTYQSVQPLAPWAIRNIGLKAFITGEDDTQGNEEGDFFAYAFERSGGTFADRLMLNSNQGNFKNLLERIETSKPDFVFASLRQKSASGFVKAFRSGPTELKRPLIGPESVTAFPSVLFSIGKASTGVKTLACLKDPTGFTGRIKRELGTEVSYAERAAEGYDIANIILLTIESGADRMNNPPELVKFIEDVTLDGPRGTLKFDKNHEPVLDMSVQEWESSGKTFEHRIVQELGPCYSLDFGCGRVGFPKKPESEPREEEPLWDDQTD